MLLLIDILATLVLVLVLVLVLLVTPEVEFRRAVVRSFSGDSEKEDTECRFKAKTFSGLRLFDFDDFLLLAPLSNGFSGVRESARRKNFRSAPGASDSSEREGCIVELFFIMFKVPSISILVSSMFLS